MFKITGQAIDDFLEGAKNTYPKEFLALLGSTTESELIDELVVVPAFYGDTSVLIRMHLIPVDFSLRGTIHSHPSPNNSPSRADLNTFRKLGSIHLIAAFPYGRENIRAFDGEGKELKFKVVNF